MKPNKKFIYSLKFPNFLVIIELLQVNTSLRRGLTSYWNCCNTWMIITDYFIQ